MLSTLRYLELLDSLAKRVLLFLQIEVFLSKLPGSLATQREIGHIVCSEDHVHGRKSSQKKNQQDN